MSLRHYADVVPFKAGSVFVQDADADPAGEWICATDEIISRNGWMNIGFADIGKKRNVSGYVWAKTDEIPEPPIRIDGEIEISLLTVHYIIVVNEDEYESVGGIDMSVVANDRQSLKCFVKIWGLMWKLNKMPL